jgi:hypothetical protein
MAASPFSDILEIIAADDLAQDNGRVVAIAQGLSTVIPDFQIEEWITEAGIARLRLLQKIKGCGVAGAQLFSAEDGTVKILKDGWNLTDSALRYNKIASNGNKPVAGPMLIIQGTEDPNANEPVNTASIRETCKRYPDSQIAYSRWEDITHVPVLYSAQHLFLDWIYDRFAGVKAPDGCSEKYYTPSRGAASAAFEGFEDQTWFVEYDKYGI